MRFFLILFLLLGSLGFGAEARRGTLEYSDGKVVEGEVSSTPGRDLKIYLDKKSSKKFSLDLVREIWFAPLKERTERRWRFSEFGSDEKEFVGEPYPIRELQASVTLSNGQLLEGRLDVMVLYIVRPEGNLKAVIKHDQKGAPGQSLKDLVYLKRVTFSAEGKALGKKRRLRFLMPVIGADGKILSDPARERKPPGPKAEIYCLERKNLKQLKIVSTPGPGEFLTDSPLAEGDALFFALRDGQTVFVGWPGPPRGQKGEAKLFEQLESLLPKVKNFYDLRNLHGIWLDPSKKQVYALVSLTRRVATPHAGMPWRLSIWRFRYDPKSAEIHLPPKEGLFFRIADTRKTPPPQVLPTDAFWEPLPR